MHTTIRAPTVLLLAFVLLAISCCECAKGAPKTKPSEPSDDLKAFEGWFVGHLPSTNQEHLKVTIQEDNNGNRGLYAIDDVFQDETVLSIPWHMMITVEKIFLDFPDLVSVLEPVRNLGDDDVIAVFLVYLKQCEYTNDYWNPWLNVLPKQFDSILYFTEDELKLLRGAVKERAMERKEEVRIKYERFKTDLFPLLPGKCKEITSDLWTWAVSVVASRRIRLVSEGVTFTAIAPFFDFFNHENPAIPNQSTWGYSGHRMTLHAEAMASYKKGQQVFISYDQKCNDDLMENYGFILGDNDDACVKVTIQQLIAEISPTDPFMERKLEILDMYYPQEKKLKFLGDAMTEEMLKVTKIVTYKEGISDLDSAFMRLEWIQQFCKKILDTYPTESTDEKIIDSPTFSKLSKRAKMAILVRKEERELLTATIKAHADLMESMKAKGNEQSTQKEEL